MVLFEPRLGPPPIHQHLDLFFGLKYHQHARTDAWKKLRWLLARLAGVASFGGLEEEREAFRGGGGDDDRLIVWIKWVAGGQTVDINRLMPFCKS